MIWLKRRNPRSWWPLLLGTTALIAASSIALGEDRYDPEMIQCEIIFNIKGWSLFVKSARGEGTISCDNGQGAEVEIRSMGGGLSVGKSEMIGAHGKFTRVRDIKDLFGSFVEAEAHAGATKSGSASVLTKGDISLAVTGAGQGMNLGATIGSFTISPR
jgi:hypothetical protein